jgi:hypothetical protein
MSTTIPARFAPRMTIPEALQVLKISRAAFYERAANGLIKIVKDGARSFVTGEELERYLAASAATS